LWALPLPDADGGGGLDLAAYFRLAEDEGRSDHGPDVLGSASLLNHRTLRAYGSSELKGLLPDLVAGRLRMSYAMTEPGVPGSDPAQLTTTATRTAGGWVLTGRKWFTTGGGFADVVLVLARTDPDAPTRSAFSLFAVPTDSPGFRVVRELDVLGAGGQHELALDQVGVPDPHLLGEAGLGLDIAAHRLALGRTLRALRWIGQAQRAVELLCARASSRTVGGAALGEHQLVQQKVFDSELAVRSARALAAQAADAVVAEQRATTEVSMAKVAASRALTTAVDAATHVHGAEGLLPETGLTGLLRTARAARVLDGSDEQHVTSAARRLLREHARST
jgi:alkylation response protein AidB-like acyl-CoA dehydrogenase